MDTECMFVNKYNIETIIAFQSPTIVSRIFRHDT